MSHPPAINPGDEESDTRCRWIYSNRTPLTAVGCTLAMGTLFVGTILMARFADRTAGWSLLITSACALLAVLSFLTIMALIRYLCPSYVVDPPEDMADTQSTSGSGQSATTSIFLGDSNNHRPRHDDTTVEDEFEL